MRKIVCFSLFIACIAGCDSRPKGVIIMKRTKSSSPSKHLAHIESALSNSGEMTVADLFDPRQVVFSKGPTPVICYNTITKPIVREVPPTKPCPF